MVPTKAIKKKKRSAEKKVDRNVLLAAATAAAASDAVRSDDSSQSLDWWDGFSRRLSGIVYVCFSLVFALAHSF